MAKTIILQFEVTSFSSEVYLNSFWYLFILWLSTYLPALVRFRSCSWYSGYFNGRNFVEQNYSSGEIFVTRRKIRHFRPTKNFTQRKISLNKSKSVLSWSTSETRRVIYTNCVYVIGRNLRRAKFLSLFKKFINLNPQSFAR